MATSKDGPSLQDSTLRRASDLFFDTLRWRAIDRERTTDDMSTPGAADVAAARGGPAQADVGFANGNGVGMALIGLAVVGGLAWAATR